MSRYTDRITETNEALELAESWLRGATEAHHHRLDATAFGDLLAATLALRRAIVAIDARLREEEKILAE